MPELFRTPAAQVNFIVPGTTVPAMASVCGDEDGLAVTYGTGYWNDSSVIRSPYSAIGTIRAFSRAKDIAHFEDYLGGTTEGPLDLGRPRREPEAAPRHAGCLGRQLPVVDP